MPIQNVLNNVNLTGTTNYYLNHPANAGMSEGYWFYYSASLANDTLGTQKIKPYRWGTALDTNETGDLLTIEGTIQLVSESLNRNRVFHGSTITRNGEGINVQTGEAEADSIFFYHLGDLRASDNAGYWDYAYTLTGTTWQYFQYHQHLPNVYEDYYGGRLAFGSNASIEPSDKRFIYMHNSEVSSMGTEYSIILARVHRPSIGGAHNSHYDVELPSVITKNYIPGGVIAGTSNRFHCFYIAANGTQWDVFSRTYVLSLDVFTSEVNHGTYDLADPNNQPATQPGGIQDKYPFRTSAGAVLGSDVYIPVIYNTSTTGSTFDLKVWKFESNNTIATNIISISTIATGYTQRPDCHLTSDGTKITAIVSDVTNGGVDFFTLSGTTWTNEGNVVTNGTQDVVRIHGFDYNTTDSRFYMLLSGDVTGSVGSFSGSGVYSFTEGLTFAGYEHVSYITGSYGFRIEQPTSGGFISYKNSNGSLVYSTATEPQGILENERILIFGETSPEFFNKVESALGGSEYFYAGTKLPDNRQVFVGNVENNVNNRGNHDFLLAIYSDTYDVADFFATGGDKDDYMNAITYDSENNKIWMAGYTKSTNVEVRDHFIHGYGRGFIDGNNKLEWKDMVLDSQGNQYFAGYHNELSASIVAKLDYNFNEVFVNNLFVGSDSDNLADVAYGITLDSQDNIYVVGSTQALSSQDAFVVKLDNSGSIVWSKYFGTNANEYASSISLVQKGSTDYLVTTIPSGSSTIVNILNTNGSIIEQNVITGFTVNRVRKSETETNGYFLLAGKDNSYPTKAKFAKGQILSSGEMLQWVRTYSSGSLTGVTYSVTNQGTNNYVFNGGGYVDTTDPTLTVIRGETYTFNVNAVGHPFWIKTAQVTGTGSTYNVGVTNNGTENGTITWTVALDAPSTLYYVCQFHIGMSGQINVTDTTIKAYEAFDIRNTEAATGIGGLGSLTGPRYHVVGSEDTDGFITKFIVDESAGTYQTTKVWGTNISGSVLTALTNDPYTLTPSGSRYTYVAGYSNVSPEGEGGFEGIISSFDYDGNRRWTNTLGHTDDEKLFSIEPDVTGRNLITAGWSESHSNGRRAFSFRCDKSGFGTGNYHMVDFPGMAMWYQSSSLNTSTNTATLTTVTAPQNIIGSLTATSGSFGQTSPTYDFELYEGGNVFDMFICEVNIDDISTYKNQQNILNNCNNTINYLDSLFTFYQWGAAGDGLADDGNFFGYDILIMTGSNDILVVGQTSGDFGKFNSGLTGVYDYILTRFNPTTHEYEFYQNGSSQDEEIYNMTELNDGSGSVAFVGRTNGSFAAPQIGGYDIFLGIYNPITDEFRYFQTGSGQQDRGINVHDIGNNQLAVVYETAGTITSNVTSFGGIDVGVIKFNYVTNTWDSNSYQVGSIEDEILSQDGKPSVFLPDTNRIGIVGKTLGNFSSDIAYGSNDIFLALFDVDTNSFQKHQIGSEGNETPTTIFSIGGDRLVIGGYSDASFTEPNNAIVVTFDSTIGVKGKSS